MDKDKNKKLYQMLKSADIKRVSDYIDTFDRLLLYTLASQMMSKDAIKNAIDMCDDVIKKGIDVDCSERTEFLESSVPGRMAKYRREPDGEEMRLYSLRQWDVARNIIISNINIGPDENYEDQDTDDAED